MHVPRVFVGLLLLMRVAGQDLGDARLTGTVSDPAEGPVPNASLTLTSLERAYQAKSAADGHFSFGAVPLGAYDLEVFGAGFVRQRLRVDFRDRTPQSLPLVLAIDDGCGPHPSIAYSARVSSGPKLTGATTDYGNKAVRADVILFSAGTNKPIRKSSSGRAGRYQFKDIPPGYYDLRIVRRGYWPTEVKDFLLPRQNAAFLDITMVKRGGGMIVCQ